MAQPPTHSGPWPSAAPGGWLDNGGCYLKPEDSGNVSSLTDLPDSRQEQAPPQGTGTGGHMIVSSADAQGHSGGGHGST